MKNQIELTQKPVIKHNIIETGKEIQKYIEALNIENQIVTNDTIQALKTVHADLNKIETVCETNRKAVKNECLSPYDDLIVDYKEQITEPIAKAKKLAKDKILKHENQIKDEKKAELEIYFTEVCESEKIDFLKFEDAKFNITLGATINNLKKQANEFVVKCANDLKLIASQEYHIEIIVEYKKTLNVSKAITDIVERKQAEKQALLKAEQKEWDRRKSLFLDISMVYHSTLKTFEYNENIYIKESLVKESSKDDFVKLVQEYKTKIYDYLEATKPKPVETEKSKEIAKEVFQKPAPPIQKPVVKEEELETSFKVKATMSKLKALIKYMDENGINYEDL